MYLLIISKIKIQQNVCLVLIFCINKLSILIVKIKYLKILYFKKWSLIVKMIQNGRYRILLNYNIYNLEVKTIYIYF